MKLSIFGLKNIPLIKPGDDLAELIFDAAIKQDIEFKDKDIIVITQKIVSKAENRLVKLKNVKPSKFAQQISKSMNKDPRIIELVLSESNRMIKMSEKVIIMETKQGYICANAGVDYSNIDKGYVSLLPLDPDRTAATIKEKLERLTDKQLAILITDTWGRPWRLGQVDFAIGVSGISPFRDYRGKADMMGHLLKVTNIAIADEIAAAAELVKGKSKGIPVVIVRGYDYEKTKGNAKDLFRPLEEDLFR